MDGTEAELDEPAVAEVYCDCLTLLEDIPGCVLVLCDALDGFFFFDIILEGSWRGDA